MAKVSGSSDYAHLYSWWRDCPNKLQIWYDILKIV